MSSQKQLTPEQNFHQKYEGHKALKAATVYSLPAELIQAIHKNAPDFFNPSELAFEQDLASLPATGLMHGSTFSYPLLHHLHPESTDEFAQRNKAAGADIDDLIRQEMRLEGLTEVVIQQFHDKRQASREMFDRIARGYAGWLVTHPEFYCEVSRLRKKWSTEIKKAAGVFPSVRKSILGVSLLNEYWSPRPKPENPKSNRPSTSPTSGSPPRLTRKQQCIADFTLLHNHWSLEQMATWELPLPLRVDVNHSQAYDPDRLSLDTGVLLHIPWYVLFQKDLKLQDLLQNHNRTVLSGAHEWLNPQNHRKFGIDRYSDMLQLYIYLELALKQRYGEDARGALSKLDIAFAEFFSGSQKRRVQDATMRLTRQKMARRLKACREAKEVTP